MANAANMTLASSGLESFQFVENKKLIQDNKILKPTK
jgi:hypothetical protein